MKKLLLTIAAVTAVASLGYSQGRVAFQNQSTFAPSDAITISAQNMGAIGGNAGWGIGGDKYAVQLRWVSGTVVDQGTFDSLSPVQSGVFSGAVFLANTSDLSNFSGFFDAGIVALGTVAGTYTFQAYAWYNQGFATYETALGGGANAGKSALFTMPVTASPTPVNTTVFPGFTVGTPIPEPGTLALAGLGAASLLLFRRKK